MTPEAAKGLGFSVVECRDLKIADRIKSVLRRSPLAEEKLAARKEGEAIREQVALDRAKQTQDAAQIDRLGGL